MVLNPVRLARLLLYRHFYSSFGGGMVQSIVKKILFSCNLILTVLCLLYPMDSFAKSFSTKDFNRNSSIISINRIYPGFSKNSCPIAETFKNTIYANANSPFNGTGASNQPYKTIAAVKTRLQNDPAIKIVCLTGTFAERLNLSNVFSKELIFYGYAGGATLNAVGESYAIYNSLYSTGIDTLRFENLHLQGFDFVGVFLEDIDDVSFKHVTIDGTGASYGMLLTNIDATDIDTVEIHDSSYSGISTDMMGDILISNSTIRDSGYYAMHLDAQSVDIQASIFKGYTSAGIVLEADSLTMNGNKLFGAGSHTGLTVSDTTSTVITNNFLLDHDTHALNVGKAENDVLIYNNSFSNNQLAIRFNDGGLHALTVISKNNIFKSMADQMAYEYYSFNPEPDVCDFCFEELAPIDNNPGIQFISDYNLFDGAITREAGDDVDLAEWMSWGYDSHSLAGDPKFVSAKNLHLKSSSPAIDMGTTLVEVPHDIDHLIRGVQYDIGADEVLYSLFNPNIKRVKRLSTNQNLSVSIDRKSLRTLTYDGKYQR